MAVLFWIGLVSFCVGTFSAVCLLFLLLISLTSHVDGQYTKVSSKFARVDRTFQVVAEDASDMFSQINRLEARVQALEDAIEDNFDVI